MGQSTKKSLAERSVWLRYEEPCKFLHLAARSNLLVLWSTTSNNTEKIHKLYSIWSLDLSLGTCLPFHTNPRSFNNARTIPEQTENVTIPSRLQTRVDHALPTGTAIGRKKCMKINLLNEQNCCNKTGAMNIRHLCKNCWNSDKAVKPTKHPKWPSTTFQDHSCPVSMPF